MRGWYLVVLDGFLWSNELFNIRGRSNCSLVLVSSLVVVSSLV